MFLKRWEIFNDKSKDWVLSKEILIKEATMFRSLADHRAKLEDIIIKEDEANE